jgi:hypothetical protein
MSDSEADVDYDELNSAQNRKKKAAGGWQSMGGRRVFVVYTAFDTQVCAIQSLKQSADGAIVRPHRSNARSFLCFSTTKTSWPWLEQVRTCNSRTSHARVYRQWKDGCFSSSHVAKVETTQRQCRRARVTCVAHTRVGVADVQVYERCTRMWLACFLIHLCSSANTLVCVRLC